MNFLKQLHEEYTENAVVDVMEVLTESIKQMHLAKKGGKINNKLIKDFIKKNPKLTDAAIINALAAYQQYKTNRRDTISLYAKTPYEKRMVKRIVDSMVKSGQFKLYRTKYAEQGGRYYELKQIKSGYR